MEHLGLNYVIGPAIGLGVPGILFVVWYFSQRFSEKTLAAYREDTKDIMAAHGTEILKMQMGHQESVQEILRAYQADMIEQRQMYKDNVLLVKNYESLCVNLKDIVILNSAGFQKLDDDISRKCLAVKEAKL